MVQGTATSRGMASPSRPRRWAWWFAALLACCSLSAPGEAAADGSAPGRASGGYLRPSALSQLEPPLPAEGEVWRGPYTSTGTLPGSASRLSVLEEVPPPRQLAVDMRGSHVQQPYDGEIVLTPDGLEGGTVYDVTWTEETWDWHLLPNGVIYPSYLAGVHEPRLASVWLDEREGGSLWDIALGARVAVLRFGTAGGIRPQGWELGVEGAALPRLTLNDGLRDMVATDFRAGAPITYSAGNWQFKLAYYHLSSHLGDEIMLIDPTLQRINYTRDAIVFGVAYYVSPPLRVYGEAAWAFGTSDGAKPWEFQFGFDYAPERPTGLAGAPFVAANVHLREDVDFGGNFVFQAGWAWRGDSTRLFRAGVQYYNGKSPQFEFYDDFEEQLGIGMWVDF